MEPIEGTNTVAEFNADRCVMGNDVFAAHASAVNVARAMFANMGIDVKSIEEFACIVTRNRDFDDVEGGTVIPMWDVSAQVNFPFPDDDDDDDECAHDFSTLKVGPVAGYSNAPGVTVCTHCGVPRD